MLAIHNERIAIRRKHVVANAFAKLSKCQQFTTIDGISKYDRQLQTLLQSYQNVSNSQLAVQYIYQFHSCKRFCKVIKMLAIHNYLQAHSQTASVANAFAKLSKCQQFTTKKPSIYNFIKLQTLLQSYQNVSNSQLIVGIPHSNIRCKRFCKVIKMLAIHN